MADDITLTVRVRDLTRGDWNRIAGNMRRLQAQAAQANRSTSSMGRSSSRLNEDLGRLAQTMQQVRDSGRMTRRQFTEMDGSLRLMSAGLRRARRDGEITGSTFRSMRRDVADLRAQFIVLSGSGSPLQRISAHTRVLSNRLRDANRSATGFRRTMGRTGDWGLRGISAATGGLALMGAAMTALIGKINMGRRAMLIFYAVVLLIGPAAQALGVLLVTVLGGAFVALGAFALKGNADVKAAFFDMKESVASTVKAAAQPMKDDLVKGIEQVGTAVEDMKPQLTQAFAAAGPLIEDLVGGITGLFARALPGFTAALANSKEAMSGFRSAMELIGDGFGEMFRIITQGNGDELQRVWIVLGNELRNVLVSLGEFISTAMNSQTATALMVTIFRSLTAALNLVAGTLDALDAIFGGLFDTITNGVLKMDGLISKGKGVATAFDTSSMSVAEMKTQLADVNRQIAEMDKARVEVPGPAKDLLDDTEKYNGLLGQRAALEGAITVATEAAAGAAMTEAQAVRTLWEETLKLNGAQSSMLDTQARLEEAFDKGIEGAGGLAGALKRSNGEWDFTTQKARDAWAQLKAVGDATNESTKAAMEAKAPWETVSSRFQDGRAKLIELAGALKLGEEDTRALTEAILETPNKTAYLRGNMEDLRAKLDAAKKRLAKEPHDSRKAAIRAEISQLEAAIREATIRMTTIDGKEAHTYIYTHHIVTKSTGEARKRKPTPGHYAQGGIVGAASGGPRSRMTLVGEHGPELVDLAPGSRVRSNPDSRQIAAFDGIGGASRGFGGGGGGGGQPIVIQLNIGDKYLGEVMVDPLRKAVRTRGGNVQAVLGKKGA